MPSIILYASRNCPTSDKARRGLSKMGVEFEERLVEDNPEWWRQLQNYSYTVPVIVWSDNDIQIGWEGEHG